MDIFRSFFCIIPRQKVDKKKCAKRHERKITVYSKIKYHVSATLPAFRRDSQRIMSIRIHIVVIGLWLLFDYISIGLASIFNGSYLTALKAISKPVSVRTMHVVLKMFIAFCVSFLYSFFSSIHYTTISTERSLLIRYANDSFHRIFPFEFFFSGWWVLWARHCATATGTVAVVDIMLHLFFLLPNLHIIDINRILRFFFIHTVDMYKYTRTVYIHKTHIRWYVNIARTHVTHAYDVHLFVFVTRTTRTTTTIELLRWGLLGKWLSVTFTLNSFHKWERNRRTVFKCFVDFDYQQIFKCCVVSTECII